MSFGRPPTFDNFRPVPPEKGSFPLDHEGECQELMKVYLSCLQNNKSESLSCRHLSKEYLKCRMERGLMAPDEFKNLGFQDKEKLDNPATRDKS
ncbi:Cytochrome c oxidase assembly protein cox19 [Entomophthora muscae]|uniref:Cytochrome c oxidase assembly protein cox19 n=2 Tax=Entomophthora muscae TaxID=34485 RepID=A0ACC2UMZ6_9FUNG|nr:Cytochrome c oxidase assembly protein cox19 [Entomophthora muscae]KAJ9088218.1 Cytochrome c oxidase assembly protein cox19 [Entomophthora muscae]